METKWAKQINWILKLPDKQSLELRGFCCIFNYIQLSKVKQYLATWSLTIKLPTSTIGNCVWTLTLQSITLSFSAKNGMETLDFYAEWLKVIITEGHAELSWVICSECSILLGNMLRMLYIVEQCAKNILDIYCWAICSECSLLLGNMLKVLYIAEQYAQNTLYCWAICSENSILLSNMLRILFNEEQ